MMKKSALKVIKEKILVRERWEEDMTPSQKQRCTGGSRAVNTVTGAMGHITLHQSAPQEYILNKEAERKQCTGHNREKKNIEKPWSRSKKESRNFMMWLLRLLQLLRLLSKLWLL
jgi:hypothetical protein